MPGGCQRPMAAVHMSSRTHVHLRLQGPFRVHQELVEDVVLLLAGAGVRHGRGSPTLAAADHSVTAAETHTHRPSPQHSMTLAWATVTRVQHTRHQPHNLCLTCWPWHGSARPGARHNRGTHVRRSSGDRRRQQLSDTTHEEVNKPAAPSPAPPRRVPPHVARANAGNLKLVVFSEMGWDRDSIGLGCQYECCRNNGRIDSAAARTDC